MTERAEQELLESVSDSIGARLERTVPAGEKVLIRAFSDLTTERNYRGQWILVTPARVLLVPEEGGESVIEVPLGKIASARCETLVGGGRLEIERVDGPTLHVPHSATLAAKFSEVARGIEQLRKDEPFLVSGRLDRTRCVTCARLLPEKNGVCPACVKRAQTLWRIASFIKPYKGKAALLVLASIAITAAELMPPLITQHLVDDVLVPVAGDATLDERLSLLGGLVLALIGVRVWATLADMVHGWVAAWLGARVTSDIRAQLYRRLEMLSLQFYDKRQVGGLISRVTNDSGTLQEFLVSGLPYLVIHGLTIIAILGLLVTMSWKITLFLLVPVPLMVAWGLLFWKRMSRLFHAGWRGWSRLTSRLTEVLHGIRVVKAFAQEERESKAFTPANEGVTQANRHAMRSWYAFWSSMEALAGLGVLVVWYVGGGEVLGQRLSIGTLLAIYSYMWLVYGPLQRLAETNMSMTSAFVGGERIFEILDAPTESYADAGAVAMPRIQGRVRFDRVTFGYNQRRPVLHDIDLDVAPGEMIGLVGQTGAGKTTMINLVARFYDADRGQITVDGVDIRNLKLEDLRSQIGLVAQEPVLFSGTIAENISYGKPGASLSKVMDAARAANAHEFVLAKPEGYDTRIGERGHGLSGGERQRIAIARAILHDPRILILDEATSSVDVVTEKQIQEGLARLVEGRTTFAIAHRLSTLRNADRLVVLDLGRAVETGTHNELLHRDGHFAELVRSHLEASEIIAVKG